MENSEPQSQGSTAKQKEIDDLRSENAFMERMGYVLAMRLLQTDIELDGEESGAISVFVPKTPSVGRGNAAGAAPVIPKCDNPLCPNPAENGLCQECRDIVFTPTVPASPQGVHTIQEEFDHFLAYSGLITEPEETRAKLFKAFEAAWEPPPVAAPLLSKEETETDLRKLLEAAVQMGEVNLEDRDINYLCDLIPSYFTSDFELPEAVEDRAQTALQNALALLSTFNADGWFGRPGDTDCMVAESASGTSQDDRSILARHVSEMKQRAQDFGKPRINPPLTLQRCSTATSKQEDFGGKKARPQRKLN